MLPFSPDDDDLAIAADELLAYRRRNRLGAHGGVATVAELLMVRGGPGAELRRKKAQNASQHQRHAGITRFLRHRRDAARDAFYSRWPWKRPDESWETNASHGGF